MNKIIKIVVVLVLVSVTVIVGVNVVNKVTDSPKGTIERFEDSYNNLDINSMIECFDPSVQALYSGANSILGDLVGFDISDMSSLVPFFSNFDEDLSMDDMPKIKIDIKDIDKTSETTAVVYCIITTSGGAFSEEDELNMVKIDGEWYISGNVFYDSF